MKLWGDKQFSNRQVIKLVLSIFLVTIFSGLWTTPVFAAGLSSMKDTMSTMTQSVASNHTNQFVTPTGVSAGQTITITFPTGFALGSVAFGDVDMATGATCGTATNDVTLAATASTTTWGVNNTGQVLTLTSATGTVTATYCVIIEVGTNATYGTTGTNQITNQTAAQNVTDQKILIGGTMADSGKIAVEVVTNSTVAVTGQVDPQISCSIAGNSSAFGTFTMGSVTTGGTTPVWTISTNATGGYSLSVKSAGSGTYAGLYSSGASYTIKSADSAENSTADLSVAATIGYGAQATKSDGDAGSATTTIAAPYTSTSNTVGRLQLTPQNVASATGPVSNATVTTTLKAKVTGLVPSGSYVDTLTYVCTGIF
jgi:hypothetical protein